MSRLILSDRSQDTLFLHDVRNGGIWTLYPFRLLSWTVTCRYRKVTWLFRYFRPSTCRTRGKLESNDPNQNPRAGGETTVGVFVEVKVEGEAVTCQAGTKIDARFVLWVLFERCLSSPALLSDINRLIAMHWICLTWQWNHHECI